MIEMLQFYEPRSSLNGKVLRWD